MIQNLITYVIIALVTGWTIYLIVRRIKGGKPQNNTADCADGCSECPLKGCCK